MSKVQGSKGTKQRIYMTREPDGVQTIVQHLVDTTYRTIHLIKALYISEIQGNIERLFIVQEK